jgi:heme/copper-type cytochrome/quinol oxidase subunit 2
VAKEAMPTEIAVCRGTVERVTTVLVTAMVLVAVMFVVVVATLTFAAHAHRRRQLDDARAQARHWVERLVVPVVSSSGV